MEGGGLSLPLKVSAALTCSTTYEYPLYSSVAAGSTLPYRERERERERERASERERARARERERDGETEKEREIEM